MESSAFVRHEQVFPPSSFNPIPVTIIGVGAGGSIACQNLAKLGITDITICDNQRVSIENVGPSLYGPVHVGIPKVEACAQLVAQTSGIEVTQRFCDASELGPLKGVVFCCVDSMQVRKSILHTQCASKAVVRMFEGRMGAFYVLTHSIDPTDRKHRDLWDHYSNYSDEDVEPDLPACGAVRVSVGPTATIAASLMVQQFIQWWAYARSEAPRASNQIAFDLERYECTAQYW